MTHDCGCASASAGGCANCAMPPSFAELQARISDIGLWWAGGASETVPVGAGSRPTLEGLLQSALSSLLAPVEAPTKAALDALTSEPVGRLGRVNTTPPSYWRWSGSAWETYVDPVSNEAAARTAADAAEAAARGAGLSAEADARAAGDAALGAELAGKLGAPAPGEILDAETSASGPNGRVVASARSADGRAPERVYEDGSRWILPSADLRSDILHGGGRPGEILDLPGRSPTAVWLTPDGRLARSRYSDGSEGGAVSREMRSDLLYGGGRPGEILDLPGRSPVAVWRTADDRLGRARYADGTEFAPLAPEVGVGAGAPETPALTNLRSGDVATTRVEEGRTVVFGLADGLPMRPYAVSRGEGAPRTALMLYADWTHIQQHGQSNREGNTGGVVIDSEPTRPANVLMLSTGVLGGRGDPSNALSIPGFLPAREIIQPTSPSLGDTGTVAVLNALAAGDAQASRCVYSGRVSAQGGRVAAELGVGSIPYDNMLAEVSRAHALAAISEPRSFRVIYTDLQGETDAVSGTNEGDYIATKTAMIDGSLAHADALGATGSSWLINQAGVNASMTSYDNRPAAAYERLVRERADGRVFMGEPHYPYALVDNWHSTAEAKVWLAELNARSIRMIDAGQRHAVSVEAVSIAGAVIHIDFLLPDGCALELLALPGLLRSGFRYRNNLGQDRPIGISLAAIDGVTRRVVLTPPEAPTPGGEVRYAFGSNNTAQGAYGSARGGLAASRPDIERFAHGGGPMKFHPPVFTRILS